MKVLSIVGLGNTIRKNVPQTSNYVNKRYAELTAKGYSEDKASTMIGFELGFAGVTALIMTKEISVPIAEATGVVGFEAGFVICGPYCATAGGVTGIITGLWASGTISWNVCIELAKGFTETFFEEDEPRLDEDIDLSKIPTFIKDNGPKYTMPRLFDQAQQTYASTYIDPILIDLNQDGIISTTSTNDGTCFDHGNDGFAETSAWVSPDDGILAIDKNNNGYIDNGSEIFGDNYIKSNNQKATNGFDALKDLDSNNDGIISNLDEEFNNIKILKGDGTLLTLEEAGIESINLNTVNKNTVDENGNTLINQSTFTKSDGTTGNLADFNLNVDKMNSFATQWLDETQDVSELPEILGSGTVYSLHQTIMRDETNTLKQLVQNFITAQDAASKKNIANQIIFKWTDADSIWSGSRGDNIDARKLHALEQFLGREYKGTDNTNRPNRNAAVFLNTAYQTLLNNICASLRSQTDLKEAFDNLEIEIDNETNTCRYNLTKVQEYIDNKISEDEQTGKTLLQDFTKAFIDLGLKEQSNFTQYANHYNDMGEEFRFLLDIADKTVIYGTDEGDDIEGSSLDEAIYAGAGDDTIYSRQGNDVVYGGDGNDYIDACEGNDTIYGGDGDDTIIGGNGNDVIYGGDGDDSIMGSHGTGHDTINAGAGDDIIIQRADGNPLLNGHTGNDTIIVEQCVFGYNTIIGAAGDDYITVKDGTEKGTANVNALYWYGVGAGNDTIESYKVNDTIRFDASITKENLYFTAEGNDLIVKFNNFEGSIRMKHVFMNSAYKIETYRFNDQSTMSHDEALKLIRIEGTEGDDSITGSGGNDTIYGYGGDDTIIGGNGNDVIYGGDGNDSIMGSHGTGHDTINAGAGDDIIIQRADGNPLLNGHTGNDTIIVEQCVFGYNTIIGAAGDDYITVKDGTEKGTANVNALYWYGVGAGNDTIESYKVNDTIRFDASITKENLYFTAEGNDLIVKFNNYEGSIRIKNGLITQYAIETYKFDDQTTMSHSEALGLIRIEGTEGDDSITGSGGNDTIYGYGGDDTIIGGNGNDVIYGGDGNDSIMGSHGTGHDTVYGGTGDDIIIQEADGNCSLQGDAGNDTITIKQGVFGYSTINGGYGDDYISVKDITKNGTANVNVLYRLSPGSGNDTIETFNSNDTLRFNINDLSFSRDGYDLIVSYGNNDTVRIKNGLGDTRYAIESCLFNDSTSISMNEIRTILNNQYAADQIQTNNEEISNIFDNSNIISSCNNSDVCHFDTYDVNKIVQDAIAYKTEEGAMISYFEDANPEKELITLVNSSM